MALTHSVSSPPPPPRLRRAQAFPTEFAASASMSSRPAGRRLSASATAENASARAAKAASLENKRVALGNLTNVVSGRTGAADAVWLVARSGLFLSPQQLLLLGFSLLTRGRHVETSPRCDTYRTC